MDTGNYVARLNEYAQKHRSELNYRDLGSSGPAHNKTFTIRAVVNGIEYPEGVGKTKKLAKFNAAKYALTCLLESRHQDPAASASSMEKELDHNGLGISDGMGGLSLNSSTSSDDINYVGLLNHYCQKKNSSLRFIEEGRCGPPHNPQFSYKVQIDNEDFPVGKGKNLKEAKKVAAELAWSALQEQSDFDSKVSVRSTASEDGAGSVSSAPLSAVGNNESSSSESIIFADSSNPQRVQEPLWSTSSSQSKSRGSPSSGVYTGSSDSPKHQSAARKMQNQTSTLSRFTADFEPMECLGRGAYGCVHKVRQKLLKKDFAVKIVRCKEKGTSLREVGALIELHHPNIVRCYACWVEDTRCQCRLSDTNNALQLPEDPSVKYLYIQMELCDTKTLKHWIKKKNTQPKQDSSRRESLSIAQQILSGVEYIHSKKLIHRDLKPANTLFGLDQVVKIGDFGLVTTDDVLMDRTENRGTPIYRAPEQEGKRNYDRKVDIFPLGLIYLELLWKVSTDHEWLDVLRNARRQMLPKEFSVMFPKENEIIELMLSEKPEDRPEASELKAKLEEWIEIYNAKKMRQESATV